MMTKRQAQNVAAAIWGPNAIGNVCRIIEYAPDKWAVIGEANNGELSGAMAIREGGVTTKYDALWHQWDGDEADDHWWMPDAWTKAYEEQDEGEDEDWDAIH